MNDYRICGTLYKTCEVVKENEQQAKRIKQFEAHLTNINICVAIIANDEAVRTAKELPKTLANLKVYLEQALKGK